MLSSRALILAFQANHLPVSQQKLPLIEFSDIHLESSDLFQGFQFFLGRQLSELETLQYSSTHFKFFELTSCLFRNLSSIDFLSGLFRLLILVFLLFNVVYVDSLSLGRSWPIR
jgi:hypothetical protein